MTMNFGFDGPGLRVDRSYTPREILWSQNGALYLPAGRLVNGALSRDPLNTEPHVLRPGLLMGRITTGGKYRPMIIGKTTAAALDSDESLTVDAATATEVLRLKLALGGGNLSMKLIGPPDAAGVVAATAITVAAVGETAVTLSGAIGVAKVTDSLLTLADGSEQPRGILDEYLRVTDANGTSMDCQMVRLLIAGTVDETQLLNWPADGSTQAWLLAQLNLAVSGTGCGPILAKGNF